MIWYTFKLGRLAFSRARQGVMWDSHGRWTHVLGPLWWLTDRSETSPDAICEAKACADIEPGDMVVQCECGGVRPFDASCGARR
jgi:hypothetical protein